MRATLIYRVLVIGCVPLISAACFTGCLQLGFESQESSEQIIFMLSALFAAIVFLWSISGITLVICVEVFQLGYSKLQRFWIFRPIAMTLLGTTAIATPVHASEAVIAQQVEIDNPFFTDNNESPATYDVFFSETSSPSAEQKLTSDVEIVQVDFQRVQPSQSPDIFFRTNENRVEEQQASARSEHVVVNGDSLWSIAETTLPPDATPANIMQRTHEIFDLNKDQLATLDSLIFAGQVLRIPSV